MRSLHISCDVGSGRAFTLVEMVVSLAILSILLLACGSIVGMATRATGDSSTRNFAQLQAADTVAQMADDLNVATNFSERTATSTTFTVPDRLNAGAPQTVSYKWSGAAGDPLMRQFNGGTATAVLTNVQSASFAFSPRTMGPAPGPAEQVIAAHDTVLGTAKDYNLDDKNWGSQSFRPSLPLGTSSYTITRVRLRLKATSQDTAMSVSIVYPDLFSKPTGATLAQTTVYESALSNQYEWIDIPFTGLTNLNPLQSLCIVMTNANGTKDIGLVQTDQSLLSLLSTSAWSKSTNAGSSWSAGATTTCARFYVFATVP